MSECEFCKKKFLNKNTLKYHQKTARFCIAIQTKLKNDTTQEQSSFNCEYCNKCFNIKHHLIIHYDICKEKKIIDEEEQIDTLKKEDEIKLNEELQKIKELKLLLKKEKEKIIELDKENYCLKTELKIKNEWIEEYKKTIEELHESHTKEISMITERLTPISITTTNNTIINTYNCIDNSQDPFTQKNKKDCV